MTTQLNRIVDSLPDFTVLNGKVITTHTITTTIKNTHRNPIRNVIVRTSLPLPAGPHVTVALQEPEGLADIDSGTVRVGDGCYAGWSTTGNRAGKNNGLFEWVRSSVEPGSRVLKAVYVMRQTPVSPSQGMIPPVASQLAINLPSRDTAKPNTSLGCPTRRLNTFFVVNSHRQTVLSLELVTIRCVSGRTATAEMDS